MERFKINELENKHQIQLRNSKTAFLSKKEEEYQDILTISLPYQGAYGMRKIQWAKSKGQVLDQPG